MNTSDVPTVSTRLGLADRLGGWRVRWAIGRSRYRVPPGLYKVGTPELSSPVLVTANYKLSFDALRLELEEIDAWILVLDTKGVNVWCAAGKGTFGTDELVRQVQATGLSEIVSHRKLVVPQLGAPGVAAHEVRRICGFKVVYGPVRARDIPAFLEAGMLATDEMRRVTFTLGERVELVGVEIIGVLKWIVPIVAVMVLLVGGESIVDRVRAVMPTASPILAGVLVGVVLVPVLLPWIPGRAFSLKGAILGAIVVGATIALMPGDHSAPARIQLFLLGTAISSFLAMQFTGSTTFTSPSGVEWEMRRALPLQIGAAVIASGIAVVRISEADGEDISPARAAMTGLAYIRGVTTIELDQSMCNGCMMCIKVCPHPVFAPLKRMVEIREPDLCIECGACALNCPEDALSVDPGVGCAAAILKGWVTRSKPNCSC